MHTSQNQENPDSNEDRQTTGFGLGQAFTAAAASLRAAGTRAQELVEGTTNAVLSSLPLCRIIGTEPVPLAVANNNVPTENQIIKNVLTLASTQSRTNLSVKKSCVIKTDIAEDTAKATENVNASEKTAGQGPAGQSEIPNNKFFKKSSITKTNIQLQEAKETTKCTENLKAPAVQTPAGQSELSNIDFFKGSSIIKSNKNKLAEGTAKVPENQKVPPVAQTAADQSELPYFDFFAGFSSFKSNLYYKQTEETAKGKAANQPESRLQLQTTIEAGTSVEPVIHVQSNLQSTGTQTDEKNESVVHSLIARRQNTATNVDSGTITNISKTPRLEVLKQEDKVPSFFTGPRLSNLTRQVSTSSQTRQCLMDASKTKRIIVSKQSETSAGFKTDRRHSNISHRPEINFIHHHHSPERDSQTAMPTSTSRRMSSYSGRRILQIEPNRTWKTSSKDLSLHRRKARRLSEVVDQRRLMSGPDKTVVAALESPTDIANSNEVKHRRSHTIPSASLPSMRSHRSESLRAREWAIHARAAHRAPPEQGNNFLKAIKHFFGRCAGCRRRH